MWPIFWILINYSCCYSVLKSIIKWNRVKPLSALLSQSKHNTDIIIFTYYLYITTGGNCECEQAHMGVRYPADGCLVRCGGGGDMTAFAWLWQLCEKAQRGLHCCLTARGLWVWIPWREPGVSLFLCFSFVSTWVLSHSPQTFLMHLGWISDFKFALG